MPGSAGEYKPIGLGSGLSAIAIGGGTPITGGTDKCILFDKAGVIGEDTNLEWDYGDQILKISGAQNPFWLGKDITNSLYNKISLNGTPSPNTSNLGLAGGATGDNTLYFQIPALGGFGGFAFQVAGVNYLDYAISNGVNVWTFKNTVNAEYHQGIGPSGAGPGLYVRFPTDITTDWRFTAGLDSNDIPYCGFGPGNANQDALLYRIAPYTLGVVVPDTFANAHGAAFHVYNKWDTVAENFVSNYERGIFDWTVTTNVLTIGTQSAGSGSTRNLQFVVGSTVRLDYGISNSGRWTLAPGDSIQSYFFNAVSTSGGFTGLYVQLNTDTQARLANFLEASNHPIMSMGGGGSVGTDIALGREAAGILSIFNNNSLTSPASIRVYNTVDVTGGAPTNYERGVFDWTTTSNVLTIGTQAGGSGKTRPINIVAGTGLGTTDIGFFDFSVTTSGVWTFQNSSGAQRPLTFSFVGDGSLMRILLDGVTTSNIGYLFRDNGADRWLFASFNNSHTNRDWTVFNQQGGGNFALTINGDNNAVTVNNGSISVAADTGGIASTNTMSSANSTTIGAGTGTVKMSSANNANNTGWLKCYIGTQVAWIPCWTTNAP